ncbi:MAG: cysteine--tRNA ligase [Proteobacteria bacterium SG_bin7]|nr:MAG: cysteine--tRNA ligase [Proteobacteria bacterium SG_bin7]
MALIVYNTLSNKKEEFKPLNGKSVKIYVCGPTVYDFLHIGNFRGPVFFNLVRNWLEHLGYQVTYILNYTDVDDKIISRAKKENTTQGDIANKYIAEYRKDFEILGLRPHDRNPRVTEFMDQIIATIEKLIANKKAYVVDGDVWCSVQDIPGYGKLSGKDLEGLIAGHRVEVGEKKKYPADFALWKKAKSGEPSWASPWGNGRPGWHIECTAMSQSILGDTIDIHGGGVDLIFPHHENEIAQSEGASGKEFVKYWMHWEFLNFSEQKMSKSLGNVVTLRQFVEKFHPEIYKFMILLGHYRKKIDFSDAQVDHAISGLARIYSSLCLASEVLKVNVKAEPLDAEFKKVLDDGANGIEAALNDDFGTPEVMARLFESVRAFNHYQRGQKVTPKVVARAEALVKWFSEYGRMMALFQEEPHAFLYYLDNMLLKKANVKREEVDSLVLERKEARKAKDFAKADEVRNKLNALNINVSDMPDGTTFWEVKK